MPLSKVTSNSLSLTTLAASGAATLSSTLGVTGVTTVQAGTAALPAITTTGDTNTGIFFPAADTIAFSEGGAEAMRIDSSGNVGIGTTSPNAKLQVSSSTDFGAVLKVSDTSSESTGFVVLGNGNSTDKAVGIWRGAANSVSSSGTFLNLGGYGGMAFSTGAALLGSQTERMRIDSSGNWRLGSLAITQGNSDSTSTIYGGATDSSPCLELFKGSTTSNPNQVFMRFQISQATTAVASGSISSNGAATAAFAAWSDRRLKENIVNLPSQLDKIMALRPVEFDYIGMVNGHQLGFIAQEVQEIYPDLVGENADGMLTLTDMNKNDARLIKAFQELKAIVDAQSETITSLTARIAALTARVDTQAADIDELKTKVA